VNLQSTPRNPKGPNPALSQFSEQSFRQDALFKDDLSLTPFAQLLPTDTQVKVAQTCQPESDPSPTYDKRKDMTFKPSIDAAKPSGKPPMPKRDESDGEEKMHTARDTQSNNGFTPRTRPPVRADDLSNQIFKTARDEFKRQPVSNFTDQKYTDARKLDYSPNVSPIARQSAVRDSIADLANAMNCIPMASMIDEQSNFQPFDADNIYHQPSEIIH